MEELSHITQLSAPTVPSLSPLTKYFCGSPLLYQPHCLSATQPFQIKVSSSAVADAWELLN